MYCYNRWHDNAASIYIFVSQELFKRNLSWQQLKYGKDSVSME
jgi:hypothetical protein